MAEPHLWSCKCVACKERRMDTAIFSCVFQLRELKAKLEEELLTDDKWLVEWSGVASALREYDDAKQEAGQ